MGFFPEVVNDSIWNHLMQFEKFAPKSKKIGFDNFGYILYRSSDGAVWGTSGSDAIYLFIDQEKAEEVKQIIDSDDSWEIKLYGLIEIKGEK